MAELEKIFNSTADVISLTVLDIFNEVAGAKDWQRTFLVHAPLRQMFWAAFENRGTPDVALLQAFWDRCAEVTNNPQPVRMPMWRAVTKKNGKISFEREEVLIPHMVLHRPWMNENADKVIQPALQGKTLKAAVKKAHGKLAAVKKKAVSPRWLSRPRRDL